MLFFLFVQLNLGIYTKDKESEFSMLVDRATGGASIKDGEVELMLHRYSSFLLLMLIQYYFIANKVLTQCLLLKAYSP